MTPSQWIDVHTYTPTNTHTHTHTHTHAHTYTIISNDAVTTRVSVDKKKQIFLLRVSLNRNKVFNLSWDQKATFKLQKNTVLLTLLTKPDLNCNDLLPRNGATQVHCF